MGKTVTVIGNYSGRNAGDAAILGNLLKDVSERYPDTRFLVPTIKPSFVRKEYSEFNVTPVSLLPWKLSLKIFGLPIVSSIMRADLVLVTDAIMFDRNLLNPVHNYLSTLALVIPLAKRLGKAVVLYNVSLGPIFTRLGRTCLSRVVNNSDILIPRDRESLEILKDLDIRSPEVKIGADCALGTVKVPENRLTEILARENILRGGRRAVGFNINSYIDVYVRNDGKGIGRENFLSIIAETVERMIDDLDVDVVFTVTQVMDLGINREALDRIKPAYRDRVHLISNAEYSYKELASVMSLFEMSIGMRTHFIILSSSMNTPVVGIIAYPKTRGFLQSISQKGRYIEFADFSTENLLGQIKKVWKKRSGIREELGEIMKVEKSRARGSADHLKPFLKG